MMATGGSADAVLDVLDKKLDAGMISEEEHAHMRAVHNSAEAATAISGCADPDPGPGLAPPMPRKSSGSGCSGSGWVNILATGDFQFQPSVLPSDTSSEADGARAGAAGLKADVLRPKADVLRQTQRKADPVPMVVVRPHRAAARRLPRGTAELKYGNMEQIGRGATATIFRAVRTIGQADVDVDVDTDIPDSVALKRYKVRVGSGDKNEEEDLGDILSEIAILSRCNSPNVLGFHEVFLEANETLWLATQLCIGSCYDIFAVLGRSYRESEILGVTCQLLTALEHLHKQKIIHRDLKCANVLLGERGTVVLADFGVSTDLSNSGEESCCTFVGSPYWIAPEVIMAMEDGSYSYPADVWSLGITMYEMGNSAPPLMDMAAMSALYQIPENDPPVLDPAAGEWTIALHDLLGHCLQKDPAMRWSPTKLLEHPALAKLRAGCNGKSVVHRLLSKAFSSIGMASKIDALAEEMELADISLADVADNDLGAGSAAPTGPDQSMHLAPGLSAENGIETGGGEKKKKGRVTRCKHFVQKKILRRKRKTQAKGGGRMSERAGSTESGLSQGSTDSINTTISPISVSVATVALTPVPTPTGEILAPAFNRQSNMSATRNRMYATQNFMQMLPSKGSMKDTGPGPEEQTQLKKQMRRLREKSIKQKSKRSIT